MNRFSGFTTPDGTLLVLDTQTGQVVRVSAAGGPLVICPSLLGNVVAEIGPPAFPPMVGHVLEVHPGLTLPSSQAAGGASASEAKEDLSVGKESWTPLDHEVVSTYPYPIAKAWSDFLSLLAAQTRPPRARFVPAGPGSARSPTGS